MILTNCISMEEVPCNCSLSFSSYVSPSVSVLDVGVLCGTTCSFSEYVIDWYVGGVLKLVSGVGSNPEIEAYHPFTGGAAIPVESGTWVPVVRYVVISGEKIFSEPKNCQKWCASLTGLTSISIIVNAITCDSTNSPVTAGYNYRLAYTTSQDFSLATRSIRFELPTGGTAVNFAMYFYAYEVADKVEVFYNDSLTAMVSWIVGSRYNSYQYNTKPYQIALQGHKFAFDLPSYTLGDYLIIRVTPSVLESNTNTQWYLDMKCLDSSYVFDCNWMTSDMQTLDVSTFGLVYDSVSCAYVLTGKTLSSHPNFQSPSDSSYPFYLYAGFGYMGWGSGSFNNTTKVARLPISVNETVTHSGSYLGNYSTYGAPNGSVNVNKSDDMLTFTYGDINDYYRDKNSYTGQTITTWYSQYTTDVTQVRHYKFWIMDLRLYPLGCGDTGLRLFWYVHISSPVTFSDIDKTITIQLTGITNGIVDHDCSSVYESVQGYVNSTNFAKTWANFNSGTTCVNLGGIFAYGYGTDTVSYLRPLTYSGGQSIYTYSQHTSPCDSGMSYFCIYSVYWQFWIFYVRVNFLTTLNEFNEYVKDPTQNYEVYRLYDANGCYTSPGTLLYRMVDGVQTYP